MRRGMGIADVMLYVFVLFLVIIAMGISVFASASDDLVSTIEIKSDIARELVAVSIVSRSVSESLSTIPVTGDFDGVDYDAYSIDQSERIAFAATYVHADSERERSDIRESSWYEEPLTHAPFAADAFRLDRTYADDPVVSSSYEPNIGPDRIIGLSTFPAGPESGAADTFTLIWLPGYVGETPIARGVAVFPDVPLEVTSDEG